MNAQDSNTKPPAPPQAQQSPAVAHPVSQSAPAQAKGRKSYYLYGVVIIAALALAGGVAFYMNIQPSDETGDAAEKLRVDFSGQQPASGVLSQSQDRIMIGSSGQGQAAGPFSLEDSVTAGPAAPQGYVKEDGDEFLRILSKYKDRPLAQNFVRDLNADPDFKRLWDARGTANPLTITAQLKTSAGVQNIIQKYSKAPEFISLIQEIMSDPELNSLLKKVNPAGGLPYGAMQNVSAMPAAGGGYKESAEIDMSQLGYSPDPAQGNAAKSSGR